MAYVYRDASQLRIALEGWRAPTICIHSKERNSTVSGASPVN